MTPRGTPHKKKDITNPAKAFLCCALESKCDPEWQQRTTTRLRKQDKEETHEGEQWGEGRERHANSEERERES